MNRETKRKIVASNKSAFKDLGAGLKFEASFILHICNLVNEKNKSVTWQDYEHIYNIYIVKWFELCAGNPLLIPDSFEKSYRPDFAKTIYDAHTFIITRSNEFYHKITEGRKDGI